MSPAMEAAHAVKALSQTMKKVILVGEALEKIGSLEQAEHEAAQRLTQLQAQLEQTGSMLRDGQATLQNAKEMAESVKAQAREEAAQIKRQAESHRAQVLEAAEVEAERVKSEARDNAAAAVASAQAAVAKLNAEAQAARRARDEAETKRDAAARELAELQERIDRARAEAKRIMGGG